MFGIQIALNEFVTVDYLLVELVVALLLNHHALLLVLAYHVLAQFLLHFLEHIDLIAKFRTKTLLFHFVTPYELKEVLIDILLFGHVIL